MVPMGVRGGKGPPRDISDTIWEALWDPFGSLFLFPKTATLRTFGSHPFLFPKTGRSMDETSLYPIHPVIFTGTHPRTHYPSASPQHSYISPRTSIEGHTVVFPEWLELGIKNRKTDCGVKKNYPVKMDTPCR